jgi:hypothetical protein
MADHDNTVPLGLALAQLPEEAPERDAWPMLADRLHGKRKRAPRWPLAMAASLLVGLLMIPKLATSPTPPPTTLASQAARAAAGQKAQLASLMSESERLERLLFAADEGASSASAAAISAAYEDQLHALDAQLAANTDPKQSVPLWQQRVELLRGVAAVETSRHYLASQGGNFDVALVAAY